MSHYRIQCLKTATHTAPEPIFLYMRGFDRTRDVNCYFWLIQGEGKKILVDTGMGGEYTKQFVERAKNSQAGFPVGPGEDTISLLESHGLQPEDIEMVILTHLHYDHIANIALFTNAVIVVNGSGWEAARNPIHPVFDQFPQDVLAYMGHEMKNQLRFVGKEEEVLPGIRVIWTGGHTACSQAVQIRTNMGRVVLTGDVAYLYDNLELDHPIGLGVNLYESVDALKRLKLAGDILLPGHDKEILSRYPDGIIT
jgi:N-acyl homoserine lactone hydrolase